MKFYYIVEVEDDENLIPNFHPDTNARMTLDDIFQSAVNYHYMVISSYMAQNHIDSDDDFIRFQKNEIAEIEKIAKTIKEVKVV